MTSANKSVEEYQNDIDLIFKKALDDRGESVNQIIHLLAQSLVDKQLLDKDWLTSLMKKVPNPDDLDNAEIIRWNRLINSIEDYGLHRQVAYGKHVASYGKWLSPETDSKKHKTKKLKFPSFIDPKLKASEARKREWNLTDGQIKEVRRALRSYESRKRMADLSAQMTGKVPSTPTPVLIFGALSALSSFKLDDKIRLLKAVLECVERDGKKNSSDYSPQGSTRGEFSSCKG